MATRKHKETAKSADALPASDARALFPVATRYVRLKGDYGQRDFIMYRGGRLPEVYIAYETWGALSRNKDNAILLFTGLSPSAHACSSEDDTTAGWWEYMIGPSKPLDTDRYHIICVNSLGSCFGSTSPSSICPDTGKAYGLDFPELCIEDIAKAAHHALHEMGIDHLHAVVGASMGGMSALAYVLQYPDSSDALITISSACRAMPFTIAVRSLQREIIRCDPRWQNGFYAFDQQPEQGMLLARKLGLMSYRAGEEWRQRFNRARIAPSKREQLFDMEFKIESYLDYNARKFIHNFDANSYLYLSHAMDTFDIADHGGSVNAGLTKIHTQRNLIVGIESDILFPIEQQQELANGLKKTGHQTDFHALDSIHGHDSFLIDDGKLAPLVQAFLQAS